MATRGTRATIQALLRGLAPTKAGQQSAAISASAPLTVQSPEGGTEQLRKSSPLPLQSSAGFDRMIGEKKDRVGIYEDAGMENTIFKAGDPG